MKKIVFTGRTDKRPYKSRAMNNEPKSSEKMPWNDIDEKMDGGMCKMIQKSASF